MNDRLTSLCHNLEKMNRIDGEEDGYYLQLYFDGSGVVCNFDEDEIFSFSGYEEAIEEFESFFEANEYDEDDDVEDLDLDDVYNESVAIEDEEDSNCGVLSDFS
jgi:hypothetical protein